MNSVPTNTLEKDGCVNGLDGKADHYALCTKWDDLEHMGMECVSIAGI